MNQVVWLLLSYQVPTEPSKARVYVWRKLKDMGAIYYRQGVAMLPRNQRSLSSFMQLAEKIEVMNGEASLAELRFLNKKDDQAAIAEFLRQSRVEYKKLVHEIASLYSKKAASKDEAILIEDKARKLEKRLKSIITRDYFMSLKEPEITSNFNQLLKDMSEAPNNLSYFLYNILNEQ